MKFSTSHFSLAAIAVAVASLAACGGGGSSGVTPNATATISTTVMDGLIQNALVCVDANANSLCDTGEIQGRTDANGQVSLTVAAAEVASARLVAMVGTDAVDADTGPVTTAYTLTTPAGRHSVISPLTTLVKTKMDRDHAAGKNTSADDAAAFVQSELTLKVSVFDDFIAKRKSSSEHQRAGDLAHGLAVLAQTSNCGWALGKDDKSKDDDATKDAARKNENRIHSGLLDKVGEIKSLDFSRASCKNGYSTECDDDIKRKVAPVPMTSCTAPPTTSTGSGTATTPATPVAPVTPTPPVDPATPGTPSTPVTPVTPVTPTQPVTPTPPVTTSASAANGKAVYAASCAMCHGSNAALGANKILRGANSASSILRAISSNQGNMGYLATSINATVAQDLAAFLAAPSL